MKIVRVQDLSHTINSSTRVYPGDPRPRLERHSSIAKDDFNLLSVQIGSQTGTHVDAPYHFDEQTEKLHEIPIERFLGRGVILNASGLAPRTNIEWKKIESDAKGIREGDIALIHTGWSKYFGTEKYFEHPYLSTEACQKLLEAGVLVFGIDAINIDETPDDEHPGVGFPVHHLIAKRGGIICENLTNFDSINFNNPLIALFPTKFDDADGAPVRAVAIEMQD
jgi:kynurenine formamidase